MTVVIMSEGRKQDSLFFHLALCFCYELLWYFKHAVVTEDLSVSLMLLSNVIYLKPKLAV